MPISRKALSSLFPPCAILFAALTLFTVETGSQGGGIFPPGARAERLFAGGEFTEGPAMGPDGALYFSDLTFSDDTSGADGHIWRFDPATGRCAIFRSPSGMSNGIEFDRSGSMIVAQGSDFGGRGLVRIDRASGRGGVLLAEFNGKPLNSPNDLVIDPEGRIYFTDPRYGDKQSIKQPVMGVYRIDPDGSVSPIIRDLPHPNGIALSPDGKMLFVGSFDEGPDDGSRPAMGRICAYPVLGDGGVGAGRSIIDFPPGTGPDGMAVDRAGHLYVAVRDEKNPGIGVFDPTGKEIARLPLPEVPSNVAFARPPHDSLLYITAGGSLFSIPTLQHGYFPYSW